VVQLQDSFRDLDARCNCHDSRRYGDCFAAADHIEALVDEMERNRVVRPTYPDLTLLALAVGRVTARTISRGNDHITPSESG
jgi:hypothetical protein